MPGTEKLIGKNLEATEKVLREAKKIFDQLGIHYIIDCGTLLGIIRENRLLPWDTNADITIRREDAKKLYRNRWRFWLKGYRTHVRFFKFNYEQYKKSSLRSFRVQTRRFIFFKKNNILDIFIKDKIDDEYQMIVGGNPTVLQEIPAKFLDETIKYNFQGQKYTIPKDYEKYLEYMYGDWKTPVKEWDFRKDALTNKKQINF
jgi:phosphorylcholine metabolism protein LicD